jgi:hypothetical protein
MKRRANRILLVFLVIGLSSAIQQNANVKPVYIENILGSAISNSYEKTKVNEIMDKWEEIMLSGQDGEVYKKLAEEYPKLSPEKQKEVRIKFRIKYREILKQNALPYQEQIITGIERYASYFAFWLANAYGHYDPKKAKEWLEKTALRYPEVELGKKAYFILTKAKDTKEMLLLLQNEFSKAENLVETYSPSKNEPQNSVMNVLKSTIAKSREYRKWKENAVQFEKAAKVQVEGDEVSSLFRQASQNIETILASLDEQLARNFWDCAMMFASGSDEPPDPLGKRYADIVYTRYRHTNYAKTLFGPSNRMNY